MVCSIIRAINGSKMEIQEVSSTFRTFCSTEVTNWKRMEEENQSLKSPKRTPAKSTETGLRMRRIHF